MVERKPIGIVVGSPSTSEFEFKCIGTVRNNDFVEVYHDDRWHVFFVKSLRREGETLYASCTCLGRPPDTPLKVGLEVYAASEDNIRVTLGLTADYSKSVYLGMLRNYNVKVYIPVDRLNRIFVVGKPGSGKSYTAGVLIEELLKKDIPIIIIDVHGEYSSLKVAAKSGCMEFGVNPVSYVDRIIEFGDKKFNAAANIDISYLGEVSAEDLVLTGKCVIINLRGLDSDDQVSIVASVVNKLLDAAIARRIPPFYLVLDEAHRFVGREKSESQIVLRRFSQEGRKFGANLIVISQRPQLLDTTVRSLSGTWIIHRLSDPNDISIAVESGGLGRGWEDSIVWLGIGECIVTGEAVDKVPYIVRVRCRETIHGGAGFNPLDYISEDSLRNAEVKWRGLMKLGAIPKAVEVVAKPKVSPLINQYHLPVKFDLKFVSSNLYSRFPFKFDFNGVILNYYPALDIKAIVNVKRSKPNVEFSDEYRAFIPLSNVSGELDYNSSRAYDVESFDESELSVSPSNFDKINYRNPDIDLSSLNSYEKIVKDFKKFLSLKLSYKLHYSTKFKVYSKCNEDLEEFKSRLREAGKEIFDSKCRKVVEKYEAKISKHNAIIKSLRDDIKVKVQSAKRLISTINDLKSKLRGLDPSSREYISISSKIQSLEDKLSKLNKMVSESNSELEYREKVVEDLKREMNDELRRLKSEFEDLGEFKTVVINLGGKDVDVEYVRLIWIPIFDGTVKISLKDLERNLSLHWNGYNSVGVYGKCDVCGSQITNLNSLEFCNICLSPLCSGHSLKCSACEATICPEHSFKCDVCGRIFCVNEKSYTCSICGKKLCSDCVKHCVKCVSEVAYCSEHIHVCDDCSKSYCEIHYLEHLSKCGDCGREVCGESIVHCEICGKPLCRDCIHKCSVCGRVVCKDHVWKCSICGAEFCTDEEKHVCSICGRIICDKHVYKCPSCGREVCTNHVKVCPNCGRRVCESCIITVKRLFRYKTGCKLCLKP